MSRKVSASIDDELHKKLEKRVEEVGVSKSAFVSFATSFLLHQLDQTEAHTKPYSLSAYHMIKHNLQEQQKKMETPSSTQPKKSKKKKAK